MKKKDILFEITEREYEVQLSSFLNDINHACLSVNKDQLHNLVLSIDVKDYGYGRDCHCFAEISVYLEREETEEEKRLREVSEQTRAEMQRERELAELERLKKKYEQ